MIHRSGGNRLRKIPIVNLLQRSGINWAKVSTYLNNRNFRDLDASLLLSHRFPNCAYFRKTQHLVIATRSNSERQPNARLTSLTCANRGCARATFIRRTFQRLHFCKITHNVYEIPLRLILSRCALLSFLRLARAWLTSALIAWNFDFDNVTDNFRII